MGMGEDLYQRFPVVKDIYQRASKILNFDLAEVSFRGSEGELKQTRITQPAVFVHSIAVLRLLQNKGVQPDMTAGHSLGEYSALVAAEALEFEEALRLVKLRGELMQRAGEENPGTMAAIIGLEPEVVEETCRQAQSAGIVQPANFNSSGQIVISGSLPGVKRAMEIAEEKGAKKVVQLEVSGAFHSPLMESAKEGLKEALEKARIKEAKIPVYANVTASPVTDPDQIRGLLCEQLTSPVRWTESIQNMIAEGANRFIEVGPGRVLTGLLKRIDRKVKGVAVGDVESLEQCLEELRYEQD